MSVEITIIPESIQLIKLTDEEYFSEKYKEYISNSRLGLLNEAEEGSEEKFLSGFKSDYSESFELGSAVHSIILQPDSYFISEITKPSGKLGVFVEEVFKLRQTSDIKITDAIKQASISANYYASGLSATRIKTALIKGVPFYIKRLQNKEVIKENVPIFLSDAVKTKVEQCILEVQNNIQFMDKLIATDTMTVFNEYAIFCEAKVTIDEKEIILKLKGKLDNFTIDNEKELIVLNDLKTTGKPAKFFMGNLVKEINSEGEKVDRWYNGSFQKYHYYRQIAMYAWLLKNALKTYYDIDYKIEANMLVVETIPNFKSAVYKVQNKYITLGLKEFKELIIKLVECNLHKQV